MIDNLRIEKFNYLNVDLKGKTTGKTRTLCPFCSETRNNKTEKCFSIIDIAQGIYKCQNCGVSGNLHKWVRLTDKKDYIKPVIKESNLSERVVKWFTDVRGISKLTLIKAKVTSSVEYMPQVQKECNTINYNYYKGETLVNIKYRDAEKHFKLVTGAELIFYNLNGIVNTDECVVCEGENDCLAFIEAGIDNVVSVPNGANKGNLNLEYVDNCFEQFINKSKIYLATDNDEPGLGLRNELLRRFSPEKCYRVDFLDCKDANEYLLKYGTEKLRETITNAKPFPVEGIVLAEDIWDDVLDLYHNGFDKLLPVNWKGFDDLLFLETGRLMTITGIPGHGKGELVDMIMIKTNLALGWKWVIYSPENHPTKLHIGKLAEKIVGKSFFADNNKMTLSELNHIKEYINENFFFIKLNETSYNLEEILIKSRLMVTAYGIKGLVIDPWNKLEHQIEKGGSETNYISKQLDKILLNAQIKELFTILVAHPTKMKKKSDGIHYEVPTLYDINGSANFYNKTDYGLTIYRDFATKQIDVIVQKIKFKHLGEAGKCEQFGYNINNGRLDKMISPDSVQWDNSNWLQTTETGTQELISYSEPMKPNTNFDEVVFKSKNDVEEIPF